MALVSKTYGRILAILLAWLGISCEDVITGADEYGTPHATYKAKGTIVSQEDGKPIKGIRVVMLSKITKDAPTRGIDSVYTDAKGSFHLKSTNFPTADYFYLNMKDVDGEENGSFIDQIVELDYSDEKFTGGKSWYKGEAEKDMGTIEMTPKE